MGHKINPKSFRLPIKQNWDSVWFASNPAQYRAQLQQDIKIRALIEKEGGPQAAIANITIARTAQKTKVSIHTGRPGVLIGRSGQNIEKLTGAVKKITPGKVEVEVIEIRKPDLSASLVAQNIGGQISRRVAYRRAVKMAIQKVMQAGALGVKVSVAGRLNGAEIARTEKFAEGSIPLSTLKANIDFSVFHAITTYGTVGVKVWILNKAESENVNS
ncbi:30S ribosomal protein S3 [Patescibacteria group bacterium]|jgi:small subunit ribosomal protein S3|nr:30S ribosomal protein S3 [Patescibacteria group bacterium]